MLSFFPRDVLDENSDLIESVSEGFSTYSLEKVIKLENVFVKNYAPNHMPDPKEEWSLKENNSELHYGVCSKVYQFIYTLVCNIGQLSGS